MSIGRGLSEIGRFLSNKTEVKIGLAKAFNYPTDRIMRMAMKHLEGATQEEIDYVLGFSQDMVDAGEILNKIGIDDDINPSSIPINPFLFGNNPEGRRAYASVNFVSDGMEKYVSMNFALPDIMTKREMDKYISTVYVSWQDKYPRDQIPERIAGVEIVSWHFNLIERRF